MNGGYLMVSKNDTNLYEKLNKALTLGKPVLWYEDENTCFYIDTITKSGTDIILTKGGKTITIENDGDITESGDIIPNIMENIVDASGNKRFIEGDVNLNSTLVTDGLIKTYGKWSLSGSHLMIVLAVEIPAGVTLSENYLSYIKLPAYVDDKIYSIISGGADFVSSIKTNLIVENSYTLGTEITVHLRRWTDTQLAIQNATTISVDSTNKRAFRLQFDLLIDNE